MMPVFQCTALFLLFTMLMAQVDAFAPRPSPSVMKMSSSTTTMHAATTNKGVDGDDDLSVSSMMRRSAFLATLFSTAGASLPAHAFRGGTGAGGLGKTRPQMGVKFLNEQSAPMQDRNGDVVAELLVDGGKTPILVSYNSPWPLLDTSSGIETRSLQQPESAFVQVADLSSSGTDGRSYSKQFFVDTIFASQGKYGAYGAPSDISITPIQSGSLYLAKFTSLTPAMRESDREAYIGTRQVGSSTVMLVTGSTASRFARKEDIMKRVAESFQVVPAPKSSLNRQSA